MSTPDVANGSRRTAATHPGPLASLSCLLFTITAVMDPAGAVQDPLGWVLVGGWLAVVILLARRVAEPLALSFEFGLGLGCTAIGVATLQSDAQASPLVVLGPIAIAHAIIWLCVLARRERLAKRVGARLEGSPGRDLLSRLVAWMGLVTATLILGSGLERIERHGIDYGVARTVCTALLLVGLSLELLVYPRHIRALRIVVVVTGVVVLAFFLVGDPSLL